MARILLAEDDPTMVQLLGTLLRMEGYEVAAVDGEADLPAAVEQQAPDALILDMIFAGQNGLQVVEGIRKGAIGAGLYVLMISGLSVREDCLRCGADDFVLKPFDPAEILHLLHSHVQNPA
jgi:two-component system OmpR family response regulator